MKRKHNLREIIGKRCYSTEEIAELLGVHIQTVRAWKKEGLESIKPNAYPYLFLGSDIRLFLSTAMLKQKVKLAQGEFYCVRCRKAVKPSDYTIIDRNIIIGKNKQSVFLRSICPDCKLKLNRFSTLSEQEKLKQVEKLVVQPKNKNSQLHLLETKGED